MNEAYFACPKCKADLKFEGSEVICSKHCRFSVVKEIYNFTDMNDFDNHWNENTSKVSPEQKVKVAGKFLSPVKEYLNCRQSVNVLDAGCGDGIHIEALNSFDFSCELDLYGLDISSLALLAARKKFLGCSTFLKASVDNMPFKREVFDVVYSYGVIGYTDDPAKSFKEMCRVTKVGGLVGIWLFPKKTGILGLTFQVVRYLCGIFPEWLNSFIVNLIVPFLVLLPTNSKVSLLNSSWKQCREVVMVNILPKNLFFPGKNEILDWFYSNDIEVIRNNNDDDIENTVWGTKC